MMRNCVPRRLTLQYRNHGHVIGMEASLLCHQAGPQAAAATTMGSSSLTEISISPLCLELIIVGINIQQFVRLKPQRGGRRLVFMWGAH